MFFSRRFFVIFPGSLDRWRNFHQTWGTNFAFCLETGLAKMEFTQFDDNASYNVMLTPNRFKHTAIEKHETTQQPCSFFRRGETMKQQRLGTELSLAPQIFQ